MDYQLNNAMTPQNTPLEISEEATNASREILTYHGVPNEASARIVQLAINSATAKLREENAELKDTATRVCVDLQSADEKCDQLKLRVEELEKEKLDLWQAISIACNVQVSHFKNALEFVEHVESLQKQIVGLRDVLSICVGMLDLYNTQFPSTDADMCLLKAERTLSNKDNFSHLYVRREVLEKCRIALQEFLDYSNGGCNPNLEDVYREQAREALTLARKELGDS